MARTRNRRWALLGTMLLVLAGMASMTRCGAGVGPAFDATAHGMKF